MVQESVIFNTGDTVKIKTAETPTALLVYTAGDDLQGISIVAINGKRVMVVVLQSYISCFSSGRETLFGVVGVEIFKRINLAVVRAVIEFAPLKFTTGYNYFTNFLKV